uniref:ADAM 17-like protease n=1 Tax=Aceria tosichella TaxID=561515 RepID=A0A6G1SIJ3_9ACAR
MANLPLDQQRHHICSYYLVLSLILLFLTIYPYLNNQGIYCSAYSGADLYLKHNLIDQFDIIKSDDIIFSRAISARSVTEQLLREQTKEQQQKQQLETNNQLDAIYRSPLQEPTKKVHFSSLGRHFNLVLGKPSHLVTEDITILALDGDGKPTKVPFKGLQVMEGYLDGEPRSLALASFTQSSNPNQTNNLMIAQIVTGKDTIMVEPAYLHKNELVSDNSFDSSLLQEKFMIVYNLRDHKQFQLDESLAEGEADNNRSSLPNLNELCGSVKLNSSEFQSSKNQERNIDDKHDRNELRARDKRDIELRHDPTKDKTRCTLHLVADYLFYKHVGNGDLQTTINYLLALINRVNLIYLPTVWLTSDDRLQTIRDIGFTVQNITIHQEYTRLSSPSDTHYNMQSDKLWGARDFLDNFSRNSPPRHYCLAHLLTYRKFDSPVLGLAYVASTRFGTIGGICSPTQQRGDLHYKHNSGISTSKGINGETLITRQADLVLAHELGHNLGAEHDSNECRPDPTKGGAYLMHPYAVMGFEANNKVFSNCSRLSIGQVIRRKAASCFIGVVDNVCGNGVVEGDEECDSGGVSQSNCCDSFCRFTAGSQCSDRHSWCCSGCHIVEAGRSCRPAEEHNCRQSAYCDGRTPECPEAPPVDDDKTCVGRGVCRKGQCIPFCEARGLQSCLCNTPPNACKLCCKVSMNSTCVPYDDKAPRLPDGVLCYRGVCEKGRCEQQIQDVVERLWDVIEDINFTTLGKFLRDNIILVVLVASIPIWCIATHYINEFDKRIKQDVISTLINNRRRKGPLSRSPFLPRLFVGDEPNSVDDAGGNPLRPLKPTATGPAHHLPHDNNADIGFRPPDVGFQLPTGEEIAVERQGSSMDMDAYSTQV